MKRFMIIDDSPVIRKILRRILEQNDFEIFEAGDAGDALDQCRAAMPDAIVVDAVMPGMDAVEFMRALRKLPSGRLPKVIYCTTENEVAQIARAMHAGADDFMMKPFDRAIVAAKLEGVGIV